MVKRLQNTGEAVDHVTTVQSATLNQTLGHAGPISSQQASTKPPKSVMFCALAWTSDSEHQITKWRLGSSNDEGRLKKEHLPSKRSVSTKKKLRGHNS